MLVSEKGSLFQESECDVSFKKNTKMHAEKELENTHQSLCW